MVVLSIFMQQKYFVVVVVVASILSSSGHSHVGSLFDNEKQEKVANLKQNEAPSAHAESTNKGVN